MNIMNIQQVMKMSKYAAILAISLRTSFFMYRLYRIYSITKPLQYKLECDFEIVWEDLVYDEDNITPQSINDMFNITLKVGSKGLIQIAEYNQKKRRFFGWKKNTQQCYAIVIQEINKKIIFSREVIEQILTYKGYNYSIFADNVFTRMRENQQILQHNLDFEFKVVQKFPECQEQLNGKGIFYYIQKFLHLLMKNREEINQINDMISHHNHQILKPIIILSYIRDIWFLQFGFEYDAFLNSIKIYKQHPQDNLVHKGAEEFFQQLKIIFE